MGDFASVFKSIRLKQGLTQQQMADKLGISRSTIGMYENGEREPNFETLELIADLFNVDMNYLMGWGNVPNINISYKGEIPKYYIDDETRQIAQEIYDNPELKSLFDMSRKMPPDRLKIHIEFIRQLMGINDENNE